MSIEKINYVKKTFFLLNVLKEKEGKFVIEILHLSKLTYATGAFNMTNSLFYS